MSTRLSMFERDLAQEKLNEKSREETIELVGEFASALLRLIHDRTTKELVFDLMSSDVLREAQRIATDLVVDYKNRIPELNRIEYNVIVKRDSSNSMAICPSPELVAIIAEASELKNRRMVALEFEREKQRQEDPFLVWLDSLPEDEEGIIYRIRNGCDGERDVARFVFNNLPRNNT